MQHLLRSFLWVLALAAVPLAAADYQVIAHPQAGVSSLSKDDVKAILLGTKGKWDNGTVIKIAVLAGGAAHEKIINDLTARSADQFDKYWKKQVFTGKGVMPETMADEAAMVAFVAKTPGAFGYVSASVKADGVKVLALP